MKKKVQLLCGSLAVLALVLVICWPTIKLEFAGSAQYTQQDERAYEFYTPDILKKMPRITSRYDFNFANITGPASHVYAVHFYDIQDTRKIDAYLIANQYQRQDSCDINAVCWRGKNPNEVITVGLLSHPASVTVQVVKTF
ncbi:hypothetical protein SC171_05250 [Pantoea cypripedii]|uniref:hypothetical protein n=1 Tax=Pantoea cypripedii TaxID=55209 RepID=UPI002FCA7437